MGTKLAHANCVPLYFSLCVYRFVLNAMDAHYLYCVLYVFMFAYWLLMICIVLFNDLYWLVCWFCCWLFVWCFCCLSMLVCCLVVVCFVCYVCFFCVVEVLICMCVVDAFVVSCVAVVCVCLPLFLLFVCLLLLCCFMFVPICCHVFFFIVCYLFLCIQIFVYLSKVWDSIHWEIHYIPLVFYAVWAGGLFCCFGRRCHKWAKGIKIHRYLMQSGQAVCSAASAADAISEQRV